MTLFLSLVARIFRQFSDEYTKRTFLSSFEYNFQKFVENTHKQCLRYTLLRYKLKGKNCEQTVRNIFTIEKEKRLRENFAEISLSRN